MFDHISDRQMANFFSTLNAIVNEGAPLHEKARALYLLAEKHDATTSLAELCEWGEDFGEQQP